MSARTTISQLPAMATYGRYGIIGRIAVGGMAEVFLAREPPRVQGAKPRLVVIKRMLPNFAEEASYRAMFLDEARLLFRIQHQGIVHVYDYGDEGGRPYLAMEWVHGTSLHSLLRKSKGGLEPAAAAKIASQVAEALEHVHSLTDDHGESLGIVHRDVTPHNIMLGWDGSVKLLDFGVAKGGEGRETQTRDGQVKGKLSYLSPEQVRGNDIDGRTDVFALGICLFESLTGRPLFRRKSDYLTFKAVAEAEAPKLREVKPELCEDLEVLVGKALVRDREHRYASAGEFHVAIERWLVEKRQVVHAARIAEVLREKFGDLAGAMPTLDLSASHAPTSALSLEDLHSIESAASSLENGGSSLENVTMTQLASAEVMQERIRASTPAPDSSEEAESIGERMLAEMVRARSDSGSVAPASTPAPAGDSGESTGQDLAARAARVAVDAELEQGPGSTLQGFPKMKLEEVSAPTQLPTDTFPPTGEIVERPSLTVGVAELTSGSEETGELPTRVHERPGEGDEDERSRPWVLWLAAAVLLSSAAVGGWILSREEVDDAGAATVAEGPSEPEPAPESSASGPRPATITEEPDTQPVVEEDPAPVAPGDPLVEGPLAEGPLAEGPAREGAELPESTVGAAAEGTEPDEPTEVERTPRRRRGMRASAMANRGEATATDAPLIAEPLTMETMAALEPAAPGELAVNTRPWSQVYLRGRLLGTTPLGSLELPPGSHTLRLVDRDGQEHRRRVVIQSGETTRAFFPLDE